MTVALPDVNVLVALALPEMVHHRRCVDWFVRHSKSGFATCATTEAGFVRLCMNPTVVPTSVSARDAFALLARWRELPGYQFISADQPLTLESMPADRLRGHRQVTDAVLLSLARQHGARLVTLDAGLTALCAEDHWRACVEVLS